MKTTRITCLMSKTQNMGNFNSLKAEWTEEILLDETDDPENARNLLRERCLAGLEQALIVNKRGH